MLNSIAGLDIDVLEIARIRGRILTAARLFNERKAISLSDGILPQCYSYQNGRFPSIQTGKEILLRFDGLGWKRYACARRSQGD